MLKSVGKYRQARQKPNSGYIFVDQYCNIKYVDNTNWRRFEHLAIKSMRYAIGWLYTHISWVVITQPFFPDSKFEGRVNRGWMVGKWVRRIGRRKFLAHEVDKAVQIASQTRDVFRHEPILRAIVNEYKATMISEQTRDHPRFKKPNCVTMRFKHLWERYFSRYVMIELLQVKHNLRQIFEVDMKWNADDDDQHGIMAGNCALAGDIMNTIFDDSQ
jgi:hypothetical protein